MPRETFTLTAAAVEQLRADHRRLEALVRNVRQQLPDQVVVQGLPAGYIGKANGVITGWDDGTDTAGEGVVDVWRQPKTGPAVPVPSLSGLAVRNVGNPIADLAPLKMSPDQYGVLWVDVVKCP